MPRVSEAALEQALLQLAEHAGTNMHHSNWMSTFLAACRVRAAGYQNSISGVNQAVEDLFVLLPDNPSQGRINPFVQTGSRWLKIADSGRSTVWNTGTRQRQKALFVDGHFGQGLRPDALDVLLGALEGVRKPGRDALAVFLTRDHDWPAEPSDEELYEAARAVVGLTAEQFEEITADQRLDRPLLGEPGWSPALLESSAIGPARGGGAEDDEFSLLDLDLDGEVDEEPALPDVGEPRESTGGLLWTHDFCGHPLRHVDVKAMVGKVIGKLDSEHIVLPDAERLVRRCVTSLLVGNLVLQGPPGTGKTTLARFLAEAFEAELIETTATSEWSPYQVVGGFRPDRDGLAETLGVVTNAVIRCAETVREDLVGDVPQGDEGKSSRPAPQAAWLFIDEFNRADIDKAIGSLFTVLSSSDPKHLRKTPIELWFEPNADRKKVWVPARFRIIAAMNDLDTSFVNQMSQGLTRRFQFVTVNVPDERPNDPGSITKELRGAFRAACGWLADTYGGVVELPPVDFLEEGSSDVLITLQQVVDGLRHPEGGVGWPVGTAQVLDVLRVVLLRRVSDPETAAVDAVDDAVASRLVPQMAGVGEEETSFTRLFESLELRVAAEALRHLLDPHRVP